MVKLPRNGRSDAGRGDSGSSGGRSVLPRKLSFAAPPLGGTGSTDTIWNHGRPRRTAGSNDKSIGPRMAADGHGKALATALNLSRGWPGRKTGSSDSCIETAESQGSPQNSTIHPAPVLLLPISQLLPLPFSVAIRGLPWFQQCSCRGLPVPASRTRVAHEGAALALLSRSSRDRPVTSIRGQRGCQPGAGSALLAFV